MKLRWIVVGLILVLLLGAAGAAAQAPIFSGQAKKKATPGKAAAPSAYDFRALMQKIFEAWSSTDPSGVAQYYAQEPYRPFYDITPLKYNDWQEYAAGYKKLMADYSSVKFTLGADARAHQRGDIAWANGTWRGDMVKKDGKKETIEGRWTAIFEKRGDNWIIVHDHFSLPAPPPPAPAKQ
jgi:ketosteroid isomerase-like protein